MDKEATEAPEPPFADLSPDDQLSMLACAVVDLLCNGFGMSRREATKCFTRELETMHPFVAAYPVLRMH